MTVVLDAEKALEAMREIVAENDAENKTYVDLTPPELSRDFLYQKGSLNTLCYYSNKDGSPSCLVGRVIAKVSCEAFRILELREAEDNVSFSLIEVVASVPADILQITPKAIAILREAQSTQDGMGTWGEAVSHAESVAAGIPNEEVE